jgi:hypothetical protein
MERNADSTHRFGVAGSVAAYFHFAALPKNAAAGMSG